MVVLKQSQSAQAETDHPDKAWRRRSSMKERGGSPARLRRPREDFSRQGQVGLAALAHVEHAAEIELRRQRTGASGAQEERACLGRVARTSWAELAAAGAQSERMEKSMDEIRLQQQGSMASVTSTIAAVRSRSASPERRAQPPATADSRCASEEAGCRASDGVRTTGS